MGSHPDGVAGRWNPTDEDGWWAWSKSEPGPDSVPRCLWFQFAGAASPPDLGSLLVADDRSVHVGVVDDDGREFRLLRDFLKVATGLRVRDDAQRAESWKLARALEMAEDPVPLLDRLEVWPTYKDAVCSCVLTGMRAGKFSKLKIIHWGILLVARSLLEVGIQSLAEIIQEGRFPILSEVAVYLGKENSCSERTVNSLLASVKGIGNIRSLSLTGPDMLRGYTAFAEMMQSGHLRALEELNMCATNMPSQHYEMIVNGKYLESLHTLNLSDNISFGENGAKTLAHAFREGKFQSLKHLGVGSTNMGNEGANILLGALVDKNLERLDVSVNGIEMLEFPDSGLVFLRELILHNNKLGDEGLKALSETLASGRLGTLQNLGLLRISASKKGVEALVSAFVVNPTLVVDVKFEWHEYPEFDRRRKQLVERNRQNAQILANLEGRHLSATFSKIYLCGYQEVGKTTLRKSLQRSLWKSMFTFERRPHREARTRGIQTSRLLCKSTKAGEQDMTMVVWDLAGQEEYHLVHNAFFSGLTFAEGSATTFLIVCHESGNEQNLVKWLRFIASSCIKSTDVQNRRHVFIVLNCKDGRRIHTGRNREYWKWVLQDQKQKFHDCLEIHEAPFIVDVRRRSRVQELKRDLLDQSRKMLRNWVVPEICTEIQSNLDLWSQEHKEFPVLGWLEFVKKVQKERQWSEMTIEAAAKYLNEAGILIFINHGFSVEWNFPQCKLIVLDPNLLCNQVLGDVFLVEGMNNNNENLFRRKVDKLGSISIAEFQKFFERRVGKQFNYKDLVSVMMSLGLCYNGPEQNLIIPALITDDSKLRCWDQVSPPQGYEVGQWIMGFSVEHEQDDISFAPMALWHRFQVELAQSREYNDLPQNDFVVGRTFTAFKCEDMVVQINVKQESSEGSPTFDGIDFLVKPRLTTSADKVEASSRKIQQVDLASVLVEMLLKLGDRICPGVNFMQRVVWPWPAADGSCQLDSKERKRRNVEVAEVRKWVKLRGLEMSMQNWTVGDEDITAGQLLSSRDTEYLLETMETTNRTLEASVRDAEAEGILPLGGVLHTKQGRHDKSSIYSDGGIPEEGTDKVYSPTVGEPLTQTDRLICSLRKRVEENHATQIRRWEDIDRKLEDIRKSFSKAHATQSDLLQKIQDLGNIFSQDRENSYPRFMYMGEEKSGAWISLKRAMSFNKRVHVHFCCEAHYDDYRLHPVLDQVGIDVTDMKDWAKTAAPWLKVSLTVLFITAKAAANVVVPGLGLLPGFQDWQATAQLAEGMALGTGYTKQELDALIGMGCEVEAGNTQDEPRQLYGKSKSAMTEFLERMPYEEHQNKLGLRRVKLFDKKGKFHSIAWICNECYKNHRKAGRAREL